MGRAQNGHPAWRLHTARLEPAAVAAGLAALVAGGQSLALLAAASSRPWTTPTDLHVPWLAAIALTSVGYVLSSAGDLRVRSVVVSARRRRPHVAAAIVAGGLGFWGLAVWGAPAGGMTERFATVGAPIVQVVLLAGWWLWARPDPGRGTPRLDRRTGANLLIVTFLALSAATTVLRLPDVYPFSEYTMYSHARLDPYALSQVVFEGTAGDGTTEALPAPASRQALLALARDGGEADLEAMAARLAERYEAPRVVVYVEIVGVPEHPAPVGLEVRERREVVTVER